MSKVALLAINAKHAHSSLAAWVLAAGIARYARLPHDVRVVEATINQPCEDIADRVAALMPDAVGISTYIWNARMLQEIMLRLRERLPTALFVLGGPEASHNAVYWLERGADCVLCGEGEQGLPALLDAATKHARASDAQTRHGNAMAPRHAAMLEEAANALHDVPNCELRAPGLRTRPAPPAHSREVSESPVDPYCKAYFDALNGRIAYIETSRGCPFRCAYCLSGGSGVRFFPVADAKERIRRLAGSTAGTVKFVDRTFNCDRDRAYELFEYVIGLDTPCRFHFEVAADLFDGPTLALLGTAAPGRIQLETGLQSYHGPALQASSRQSDLEKAERSIRALVGGRNIKIHVGLIAGLPYETLDEFRIGFDRAYALGAHTLQLGFLKLLHGSALREKADALELRYDAEPPYEIAGSPWLGADDLQTLKTAENALQHTYNKGRFLSSLEYALSASGMGSFSLFLMLGESAPNRGTPLDAYAEQVFACLAGLRGVDRDVLADRMVCDWLGMVKGKNMPPFLKNQDSRRRRVAKTAEERLGRVVGRQETTVLLAGMGVYVDSASRDPVTNLYRLGFVDL